MWFIKHTKTGEILNISQEKTTIGRLRTTYVLKNDDSISRTHCTFLLDANGLKIIDEGSKYGTTVNNDNKITKKPTALKAGDKILFGCFENIWKLHYKEEVPAIRNDSEVASKRREREVPAKRKDSEVAPKIKNGKVEAKQKENEVLVKRKDSEVPVIRKNNEAAPKRKHSTSDENSLSVSNVTKKLKEDEATATSKALDKYDLVFGSSDEDLPSGRPTRSSTQNVSSNLIENKSSRAQQSQNLESKSSRAQQSQNFENSSRAQPSQNFENSSSRAQLSQNLENDNSRAQPSQNLPALNLRKRNNEDDVFNFEGLGRRQQKRLKQNDEKKEEIKNDSLDSSPVLPSTSSTNNKVSSFAYKTSNLCNKELFASFDYNIDDEDSGAWISVKLSNIDIKKESFDETDESSMHNSFNPPCSYSGNITRKAVNLDASSECTKTFRKQKYAESTETGKLRKLNVTELNFLDVSESTFNFSQVS